MVVLTRDSYSRVLPLLEAEEQELMEQNKFINCSGWHHFSNLPKELEEKIYKLRDEQ